MNTLTTQARAAKQHLSAEAEKRADQRFLERMKKRKPADPKTLISHADLKKRLGP